MPPQFSLRGSRSGGRRATKKKRAQFRLDDPARYTAAELFYLRNHTKYLEELRTKYPDEDEADLIKRFLKWAGQQGHDLLKDSASCGDELRGFVGEKPHERRVSYANKLVFHARGVFVNGETMDLLIPADFLIDSENDFELRKYVERLRGEPPTQEWLEIVQKWTEQAERVEKLWRRFRRAAKGSPDQGRPQGPGGSRSDVVGFRSDFFKRVTDREAEEGDERRGQQKEILAEMVHEDPAFRTATGAELQRRIETLKRRLYR